MSNLVSFIIGMFSSLIASYIYVLFGSLSKIIPPKFRRSFDREFKNQSKAIQSIRRDAKKSSTLRVVTMKGDTFSNPGTSGELHDLLINGPTKQKYLISKPDNPYVAKRANELRNPTLNSGIQNSIANFEAASDSDSNIEIRKHCEILRFRLIIFDDCLYLSFQSTDTPGKLSPMQRYIKPSSGYSAMEALFEDLWKKYETKTREIKK